MEISASILLNGNTTHLCEENYCFMDDCLDFGGIHWWVKCGNHYNGCRIEVHWTKESVSPAPF